jgi:glycine/D-amino acid oxidase-like deaminating enzyme
MTAQRRQAADIKNDYGVEAHYISAAHLSAHGMTGPFHGAMTIPIGFALNPRNYANGLLGAAQSPGAKVFARSPVTGLQKHRTFRLNTPQGQITAEKVIFATNGYSSEHLPDWMHGQYLPVQSSMIVSQPLTANEQAAQGWTSPQMAFDSRELLHYFRLMPDGRFLLGMRDGIFATARANRAVARKIRADFRQIFPAWADVDITDRWSGLICLTRNLTPYIGPMPGLSGAFSGLACHGNGIAMGSYAGTILANLL